MIQIQGFREIELKLPRACREPRIAFGEASHPTHFRAFIKTITSLNAQGHFVPLFFDCIGTP
jgi:hypothetical protein